MQHEDTVRMDETLQQTVKNLFIGCAPERAEELTELWRLLEPKFQLVGDVHEGERIIFDAGLFRFVRFNHRAIRAFWVAAYAAWEGYRAAAETLGDTANLTHLVNLIDAFETVLTSDKPEDEPLPSGVPAPGSYPEDEAQLAANAAGQLATMALGWALLHEVSHIKLQQDGKAADPYDADPTARREEELACDAFATEFLLRDIGGYAQTQSVDPERVRRKRELGIYFALFTIVLLARDKWGASNTHPSVQDRIDAVASIMGPQRDSIAEAMAYTSFAVLGSVMPNAPQVPVRS